MKKIKINELIFFCAYVFTMFYYMFSNVLIVQDYRKYIIAFTYGLLFFNIIIQSRKYSYKSIFIIAIILIISIISWRKSKDNRVMVMILFLFSMKNIEFDKVIKVDLKFKLFFIIAIVLLYKLGYTDSYYMVRDNGMIRSSMGFSHPNVFGLYVFGCICDYVYLCYRKSKRINYLLLIIVYILVSRSADSRTAQMGIISIILFYNIFKRFDFNKKIFIKLLPWLFLILGTISYTVGSTYDRNNMVLRKVNNLFSTRISLMNDFLDEYEVTLFGNQLDIVGTRDALKYHIKTKALDNAFVKILLMYGLLVYILYAIIFYVIIYFCIKKGNNILLLLTFIFLFYGLMENALYQINHNIFILYFSNILYSDEKIYMKKKDMLEQQQLQL